MNEDELRQKLIDNLVSIAPELDPLTLDPDKPLRSQVDLDSFDWLRYLVALHEEFGIEIPESDYHQLTTLSRLVDYLKSKVPD